MVWLISIISIHQSVIFTLWTLWALLVAPFKFVTLLLLLGFGIILLLWGFFIYYLGFIITASIWLFVQDCSIKFINQLHIYDILNNVALTITILANLPDCLLHILCLWVSVCLRLRVWMVDLSVESAQYWPHLQTPALELLLQL